MGLEEWVDLDKRSVVRASVVSVRLPRQGYVAEEGSDVFVVPVDDRGWNDEAPDVFKTLATALEFAHKEQRRVVFVVPFGLAGAKDEQ